MTYADIKTWFDTYINTNGAGEISGADANQGFVTYMLTQLRSVIHDITRPYLVGDIATIVDGDYTDIYQCITANGPEAFNATKWKRISIRKEVLTETIAIGTNAIAHTLGVAPDMIYIKTSAGANIPFDCTASDTTTITIESLAEYVGAKITLIG